MTHPEELLAPYVDGTASPQERAAVDAHASSCARCRGEIAAATAARAALRRLPVVDAPLRASLPICTVASGPRGGRRSPGWYRWAGAAAVAAVIALLLALVVPHLGGRTSGDPRRPGRPRRSGPRHREAPGTFALEIQAQDYADASLKELITTQAAAAPEATFGSVGTASDGATALKGTTRQTTDAQACIKQAFKKVPGQLVRLISAHYAGAPAYIGIYDQGPGPNQTADTIVGRVAAVDTCTILTLVQARRAA